MMLKITYKVGGVAFTALALNIAQAYEYVAAVIRANNLTFPKQEETLSEYMAILGQFKNGKKLMTENHIFKIEVDRSKERIQHLTESLQDAETTLLKLHGVGGKYCDEEIECYQERMRAREEQWSNG